MADVTAPYREKCVKAVNLNLILAVCFAASNSANHANIATKLTIHNQQLISNTNLFLFPAF